MSDPHRDERRADRLGARGNAFPWLPFLNDHGDIVWRGGVQPAVPLGLQRNEIRRVFGEIRRDRFDDRQRLDREVSPDREGRCEPGGGVRSIAVVGRHEDGAVSFGLHIPGG
jgi:hypothetical protein